MAQADIELVRHAWEAFGVGDLEAATAALHPAGSFIQTHVPAEWGERPTPHGEVVTVRDGKIVERVVYPTVDGALSAADSQARGYAGKYTKGCGSAWASAPSGNGSSVGGL